MTLKKIELLAMTTTMKNPIIVNDWIFKRHVYTLVGLKSNRIRLLIVRLGPLDYSIDSRINGVFQIPRTPAFRVCNRENSKLSLGHFSGHVAFHLSEF